MTDILVGQTDLRPYYRNGLYAFPYPEGRIIQTAQISDRLDTTTIEFDISKCPYIFLETFFDPIGRIKRGKFFSKIGTAQPGTYSWSETMGGNLGNAIYLGNPNSTAVMVQAFHFQAYQPSREHDLKTAFVRFGNSRLQTRWKILTADPIITNEEVYVLQEVGSIGAIPSLNLNALPEGFHAEVQNEYSALVTELHGSPETVVDHCRDAATSLLSAALNLKKEDRKDLGDLVKKIEKLNLGVAKSCAETINRLHPRRKPNESDKHGLATLTQTEADYAVQSLFQLVRELKFSV